MTDISTPVTDAARLWDGWGTATKPAHEPVCMARKPLIGTVAANVLAHGTGALNIDASRIGTTSKKWDSPSGGIWKTDTEARAELVDTGKGRWPSNFLMSCCGEDPHLEGCPVAELDRQSGVSKSGAGSQTGQRANRDGFNGPMPPEYTIRGHGDTGGASRFFYVAKPSQRERSRGLPPGEKNIHSTVKPIALMKHLVGLVTPPSGLVLDMFCGSGTTGCACAALGFDFVGIDQDAAYLEIARLRIEAAAPQQPPLQEAI